MNDLKKPVEICARLLGRRSRRMHRAFCSQAGPSPAQRLKMGRCPLIVNGKTRISGKCAYKIEQNGEFYIEGPRQIHWVLIIPIPKFKPMNSHEIIGHLSTRTKQAGGAMEMKTCFPRTARGIRGRFDGREHATPAQANPREREQSEYACGANKFILSSTKYRPGISMYGECDDLFSQVLTDPYKTQIYPPH